MNEKAEITTQFSRLVVKYCGRTYIPNNMQRTSSIKKNEAKYPFNAAWNEAKRLALALNKHGHHGATLIKERYE